MTSLRTVPLLGACLVGACGILSGCASANHDRQTAEIAQDRQFNAMGRAVRQNIAAQIADPDPVWKTAPPAKSDGKRAAERMSTYATPSKADNGEFGGVESN